MEFTVLDGQRTDDDDRTDEGTDGRTEDDDGDDGTQRDGWTEDDDGVDGTTTTRRTRRDRRTTYVVPKLQIHKSDQYSNVKAHRS